MPSRSSATRPGLRSSAPWPTPGSSRVLLRCCRSRNYARGPTPRWGPVDSITTSSNCSGDTSNRSTTDTGCAPKGGGSTGLRAGTFEESDAVQEVDAGFTCHYCGADVTARIERSILSVDCPDCAYTYGYSGAPPGAVEGESTDLEQVAAFYQHRHLAFARGVCITCGNDLDTELLDAETAPYADSGRRELSVSRSCARCGDQRHLTLGTALLLDPEVISFCHEHGVDVFATPLWELAFAATDRGVTVRSTDPWAVSLTIEFDGDALTLHADGDLNVVERTRS